MKNLSWESLITDRRFHSETESTSAFLKAQAQVRNVEGLRGMQTEMKMPPLRSELPSEIPIYSRHYHEVAQEHQ